MDSKLNKSRPRMDWSWWPVETAARQLDPLASGFQENTLLEFEDESLIRWGMLESAKWDGARARIDVLYGCEDDLQWRSNVGTSDLEKIVSDAGRVEPSASSQRVFKAFFVDTKVTDLSWLPGNFSIPPTSLSALRRAGLSDLIISAIFTKSGEWINMGSQRSTSYDESGNLSSFSWLYCYQGGWNVGKCFTQFSRTQYGYTYFCINYPPRAYQRLRAYVSYRPNVVYRTLFVDTLAAGECLRGFQEVVDDKRIDLFFHEKQYTDEQIDFDNAPRELHRLSKHWHTLMQDCGNFDILLDFMHAVIPKYRSKLHKAGWKLDKSSKPKETWNVLRLQSGSITRWTMVYRDRTNLRINLLFHLTNQREARTNTQIAASTAKVAEQTQRDSASMITIAAVTMFFLPGTFVSAILSTTFFDHGPDGLQVSKKWWILLAATLPLTIVVFAVWFGWRYLKIERKQTSDIAEKKLI